MMRRKQALSWIAASGLVLSLAGCTGGDDSGGDTTITAGTTAPLTGGMDDDSTDGGSAPATDSSGGGNEESTGDPPVTCDPPCADDQQCVAGQCIGGGDSSGGGGECPAGEMCQMTGAGTMACLGEPTHCALPCGAGSTCPDPMVCGGGGVCEYDAMMLPMDGGNPDYPAPDMMGMCPEGSLAAMFSMGHVVCIPECDMNMCPGGGVCATNPTSSGQAC